MDDASAWGALIMVYILAGGAPAYLAQASDLGRSTAAGLLWSVGLVVVLAGYSLGWRPAGALIVLSGLAAVAAIAWALFEMTAKYGTRTDQHDEALDITMRQFAARSHKIQRDLGRK